MSDSSGVVSFLGRGVRRQPHALVRSAPARGFSEGRPVMSPRSNRWRGRRGASLRHRPRAPSSPGDPPAGRPSTLLAGLLVRDERARRAGRPRRVARRGHQPRRRGRTGLRRNYQQIPAADGMGEQQNLVWIKRLGEPAHLDHTPVDRHFARDDPPESRVDRDTGHPSPQGIQHLGQGGKFPGQIPGTWPPRPVQQPSMSVGALQPEASRGIIDMFLREREEVGRRGHGFGPVSGPARSGPALSFIKNGVRMKADVRQTLDRSRLLLFGVIQTTVSASDLPWRRTSGSLRTDRFTKFA